MFNLKRYFKLILLLVVLLVLNRTIVYAINDPESMSIDSGVSIYYENGTQLSIEDAANAR